jgi:hypothetical protein
MLLRCSFHLWIPACIIWKTLQQESNYGLFGRMILILSSWKHSIWHVHSVPVTSQNLWRLGLGQILMCSLSQILSSLCSFICDLILQDVFADCVECKFTGYFGCRGHTDPNSSRVPQVCHNPDSQWVRGGTINRDANKHLGANYQSYCQDPKLVAYASLARHGISVLCKLHIRGNSLCLWVLWVMQGKSCFLWF